MNEKRKSLRISFEYQDLFMHRLTKTCDIIGIIKVKYKKVLSLHTCLVKKTSTWKRIAWAYYYYTIIIYMEIAVGSL